MRIALISDIHGNPVAFEAVLADIAKVGVDQIIFLGDIATMGPCPNEALAQLQDLGCPCIMGNHDENLFHLDQLPTKDLPPWYVDVAEWTADKYNEAELAFIQTFVPNLTIPLDEAKSAPTLLCYHGSPRSNQEFLLVTTSEAELYDILGEQSALVLAGGHSHVQMIRRYGESMVVTVGSIGFPLQHYPFTPPPPVLLWAEYGIISWQNGVLSMDLRRVDFDLKVIRDIAAASGMPHLLPGQWWP